MMMMAMAARHTRLLSTRRIVPALGRYRTEPLAPVRSGSAFWWFGLHRSFRLGEVAAFLELPETLPGVTAAVPAHAAVRLK